MSTLICQHNSVLYENILTQFYLLELLLELVYCFKKYYFHLSNTASYGKGFKTRDRIPYIKFLTVFVENDY